jgi:YD repeat-containing protein
MKYPDNETVTTAYNSLMQPESLSGSSAYISDTNYDAAGRVTSRALGNGLTQSYTYYGWSEKVNSTIGQGGRLKTLSTGSLQNLAYQYDPAGNITQIFDSQAGETQVYTYDPLDRLTSWTMNNLLQESYTYNATTGNLTGKAGVTLSYTDSNHDHAVTGAGGNSYGYDANGNQTTRVIGADIFNLKYNAENQLVEVKKNSVVIAAFMYDGDGRQVKSTVNGVTTLYVGGHYEVKGNEVSKYYFAGASRIELTP